MKTETTQADEPWNKARFIEAIAARSNEKELLIAEALFEWVTAQSLEIKGGRGLIEKVLYLQTNTKNKPVQPFSLITKENPRFATSIRIHFDHIQDHSFTYGKVWKQGIVQRLNEILGKNFPLDKAVQLKCRIKLSDIADVDTRNAVLEVLNGILIHLSQ